MMTNETKIAAPVNLAWPAERRAQLGQLERMLRDLESLNNGSGFIEKVQAAQALAKKLLAWDQDGVTPSFYEFLRTEATREVSAPAQPNGHPELEQLQVTVHNLPDADADLLECLQTRYASSMLETFGSAALAVSAYQQFEKAHTSVMAGDGLTPQTRTALQSWSTADQTARAFAFHQWGDIGPKVGEVTFSVELAGGKSIPLTALSQVEVAVVNFKGPESEKKMVEAAFATALMIEFSSPVDAAAAKIAFGEYFRNQGDASDEVKTKANAWDAAYDRAEDIALRTLRRLPSNGANIEFEVTFR